MLKFGVTGVHDAGVSLEDIALFKKAIDRKAFSIRMCKKDILKLIRQANVDKLRCHDGV
jgi:hypothetical protein